MRIRAIAREAKRFNRRKFIETTAAAALLASVSPVASAGGKKTLSVGVAKRRVTPPLWVPYLTSSNNGTNAPFKSFHDELYARALVLENGSQRLAVLAVDSIGYDNSILGPGRDFTGELRRLVARKTGLPPDAIMLAATHAHSVPETIGLTPFGDSSRVRDWLENHLHELAATVVAAWNQRAPGRAFFGTTQVEGIARNRRILLRNGKLSVYGPVPPPEQAVAPWQVDETLSLLCFENLGGDVRALLMNYTAHPVVAMLLPAICADYPGYACTAIEAEIPGAVCLFTNGAAGNINSVKVSTNFDDVATLGRRLADAALAKTRERASTM